MRITNPSLTRNYLSRMHKNHANLTSSNERLSSGRKYTKSSQNVQQAGKALRFRRLTADNERYQTTIRDSKSRAEAAEDSLLNVSSLLIKAKDRIVEAANGTLSLDEREMIATEIDRYQDELFQVMNSMYNDKYMFSASGNSTRGQAPFTKDPSGNLLYNDNTVLVDDMVYNSTTGKVEDGMGNNIKYNSHNYVDIGFGYKINGDVVDTNTAFKDTFSGVESFGYGKDPVTGVPVNAYSLFGYMSDALRADNVGDLRLALDTIPTTQNYVLKQVTEIGARGVLLDDTLGRLEGEYTNLVEKQNELEYIDVADEMIHNKEFELSWMVTLQLGSKIIPPSIFDYLR